MGFNLAFKGLIHLHFARDNSVDLPYPFQHHISNFQGTYHLFSEASRLQH